MRGSDRLPRLALLLRLRLLLLLLRLLLLLWWDHWLTLRRLWLLPITTWHASPSLGLCLGLCLLLTCHGIHRLRHLCARVGWIGARWAHAVRTNDTTSFLHILHGVEECRTTHILGNLIAKVHRGWRATACLHSVTNVGRTREASLGHLGCPALHLFAGVW